MSGWLIKSAVSPAEKEAVEEQLLRWKYETLRNLLSENSHLLSMMADIQANSAPSAPMDSGNRRCLQEFSDRVLLMIEGLNILTGDKYRSLEQIYREIERSIFHHLTTEDRQNSHPIVLPLESVDRSNAFLTGGKGANLGEAASRFPSKVPPGFIITTTGYFLFLRQHGLGSLLRGLLSGLEIVRIDRLANISAKMMRLIEESPIPCEIIEAIDEYSSEIDTMGCGWAVRSSAVGEDGTFSFAGQFESYLNVPKEKLPEAYRSVIASRFSERALSYRLQAKLRDVDSPMAVLFMPVVDFTASGVVYTQEPQGEGQTMMISSTWGLAADLVTGEMEADIFIVERDKPHNLIEKRLAVKKEKLAIAGESGLIRAPVPERQINVPSMSEEKLAKLAELSLALEKHFGRPQDIEWGIDLKGELKIMQCRPLSTGEGESLLEPDMSEAEVLLDGGMTIFPGRAGGKVAIAEDELNPADLAPDSVIVAKNAAPEHTRFLDSAAGFISESGSPTSHLATVLRERAIPSIFGMAGAMDKLRGVEEAALDSSKRKVYMGLPWPKHFNTVRRGKSAKKEQISEDLLTKTVFTLNLYDPQGANFTPAGCKSFHDIIRYVHEKAVEAVFHIGDKVFKKRRQAAKELESGIQLNLIVLDIGGAIRGESSSKKKVSPEDIDSIPFQALWRGMIYPGISWQGRRNISFKGFSSVMVSSIAQGGSSTRRLEDRNYLMVAPEYLNLNARLAYHYSMIDSVVGEHLENNFVNFRFRGGGTQAFRRDLRGRFLTEVLVRNGFTVDNRGDLVTAWLRGVNRSDCERGLELLGKLMGCARQLDMLLDSKERTYYFVDKFMEEDYEVFA